MIRAIRHRLRRFLRQTDGGITLEAILYMPPILMLFLLSLVLFDGFRTNNLSQKAAYAIADAISRETVPLDDQYLNGMENVYTEIVGQTGRAMASALPSSAGAIPKMPTSWTGPMCAGS